MMEIKRCPFCGSKAELNDNKWLEADFVMFFITCTNDDCITNHSGCNGAEEAINKWNTKIENIQDYAAALGRKGGKKGGKARAEALSPERRAEISKLAASVRWTKKRYNADNNNQLLDEK